MKKIASILLFGLLALNTQVIFAADTKTPVNEQAVQNKTKSFDEAVKDYNFEDNSYQNISDEQLQEIQDINKIDDNSGGFWSKVINSGHFSSNTATKTYIPINKVK